MPQRNFWERDEISQRKSSPCLGLDFGKFHNFGKPLKIQMAILECKENIELPFSRELLTCGEFCRN